MSERRPPSALLESLLDAADAADASDIHLKPEAPVCLRVDGQLVDLELPPPDEAALRELVSELLPPGLAQRDARERPREVDVSFRPPRRDGYRVNIAVQGGKPVVAMRRISRAIPAIGELNLPPVLAELAECESGLVLLAGRTGAGKTTALAAMVGHLNRSARRHIVTLEDPIEYLFADERSRIEQREIGLDTASFESGFRNLLRQDPDVVVIGELRDQDGIRASLRAARAGRLVLATVHAATAARTIGRLLELLPSAEREVARGELSEMLRGVLCLRLLKAAGGGRVPASELLLRSAASAKAIRNGAIDDLGVLLAAGDEGVHDFNASLAALVADGRISRESALACSDNPSALQMKFQGIRLHEERRILGGGS